MPQIRATLLVLEVVGAVVQEPRTSTKSVVKAFLALVLLAVRQQTVPQVVVVVVVPQ
jgi:hypothetical protein